MLMFIFGAGASYDSDPQRKPEWVAEPTNRLERYRPPLTTRLFEPLSDEARGVFARHMRANALVMELQQAVEADRDLEEFLEELDDDPYRGTKKQMLALRALLSDLMETIPAKWAEQCQGRTNYVLALMEAARWRENSAGPDGLPITAVSFNYDTLIEQACGSVFGMLPNDPSDYLANRELHLYKPHGSVNWSQRARTPANFPRNREGLQDAAIESAAELEALDEFRPQMGGKFWADGEMDIWLPGLMLPLFGKSEFMLPREHLDSLSADLSTVDLVVAVGWRAREQHFLRLLEEHMPHGQATLIAVAESESSAMETVDRLWSTGRFQRYGVSTAGFSAFTSTTAEQPLSVHETGTLRDVLNGVAPLIRREPGR